MATFCQGAGISKVVLVTEGSSAAVFLFLSGLTPLTLTYIFEPVTAFLLLSVTVVALLTVFQFAFVSSKVSDFERTTYWYCCFEIMRTVYGHPVHRKRATGEQVSSVQ